MSHIRRSALSIIKHHNAMSDAESILESEFFDIDGDGNASFPSPPRRSGNLTDKERALIFFECYGSTVSGKVRHGVITALAK